MTKTVTSAIILLVPLVLLGWMSRVMLESNSIDGEILGSSFLLAAGLIYWAAGPWKKKAEKSEISLAVIAIGLALFAIGSGARIGACMALGWALIAMQTLRWFISPSICPFRLGLLLFFATPWILMDLNAVGWWFRLSAAVVSEFVFGVCGLSTSRNGTFLEIDGMNVSVEEACSGLRQFHMLLLTGVALAVRRHLKSRFFWLTLALVPVLAWIANTIRVVLISAMGMAFGVEFASGVFHDIGGIFVTGCMFLLTWLLVNQFQSKEAFA